MLCYLWVLWTDIYRVSGLHRVRNWGPVFHEYLLTKWLKGVPNKISLNLEGCHEILHIFCCMILVRNHYQNSELKRPQCLNKPQVDQDMIHAFSLQSTSQKSCFCWVLFVPVSWGLVRVSHTHNICIYIYYSLHLHICILWSLYPMSNIFSKVPTAVPFRSVCKGESFHKKIAQMISEVSHVSRSTSASRHYVDAVQWEVVW